jgi:protein-disulfide isomerase
MNKDTITATAAVVLATCAVLLTALNVRKEFFPPMTRPDRRVDDWASYALVGHRMGSTGARVTIVVFGDYECSGCRRLERQLYVLRQKYQEDVAVVWRHFPLAGHEHAEAAAAAAVCVAEQGRFEAYHELLMHVVESIDQHPWVELAAEAGVRDTSAFEDCMLSDRPATIIECDVAAARTLGVVATPTFLVNAAQYTGTPRDLEEIVRREVQNPAW